MKKFRKNSITCTGDNYKVQQLRLALEGMDLNKHPEDWDVARVKSSYSKGINLDKGAINLLIDYYTNTYDPKKDEFSSDYVESACNRRKAVKANDVYRNTNPTAFSKFLGDVSNGVKAEYGDTYDIKGTRFVDDEVVIYELIVRDRYNSGEEISYLTIEQSADGFRVWREGDEETEFAVGKSFDDILEDCIDECGAIIEEVEGTEY